MSEAEELQDTALLYAFDELGPSDRRAFEAQIAESPEILAHVRELEEGAVAVALALPPRQTPELLWQRIENSIAQESARSWETSLFRSWIWRSGWPAAAACLLGWLLYGLYVHRPGGGGGVEQGAATSQLAGAGSEASRTESIQSGTPGAASATGSVERARAAESRTLRNQLADLQRQIATISHSVTQQQAMLDEASRMKFVQFVPRSNLNAAAMGALSTELQRALFVAMARELGWLNSTNEPPAGRLQEISPGVTNAYGVNFVDFRSATNTTGAPVRIHVDSGAQPSAQVPPQDDSAPLLAASDNTALPAFVARDHVVVALNNSLAPPGSVLTFTANGTSTPVGSTFMTSDPLVVTMPFTRGSALDFVVVVSPTAGSSNVIEFRSVPAP